MHRPSWSAFRGLALVSVVALVPVIQAGETSEIVARSGVTVYRTDRAIADVQTLLPPASAAEVHTWRETLDDGRVVDRYVASADGLRFSRVRDASYVVRLRYATFDPLAAVPAVEEALASGTAGEIFIVQFRTRPIEAYRAAVRALGGEVYGFLADQAHLVRLPAGTRAAVEQLPFVRWVGPYHPAYRVDDAVRAAILSGDGPAQRYSIQLHEKGPAPQARVAAHVATLGGAVTLTVPGGLRMEAELTPAALAAVVALDDVLFVDVASDPEVDVNLAREVSGANYVESIEGYDGSTVRGEVMDGGLRTTHQDFAAHPPLIHGLLGSDASHGTSVYGIVFGGGTGNGAARGFLPGASPIFSSYETLGDRYAHTAELVDPVGLYRACFQTNSWGGARTTTYTTVSAEMDDLLFDHDIVITQSQSNAGNQDSRPQAWAKNIVSIGAMCHFDNLVLSDDRWGCGTAASIGPAADGRVKPDLMHFYDATLTTYYTSDSAYTSGFGGTSGATPIVAGHFGLFFEMWADGLFGNPVGGGDAFDEKPHMTTAKAIMINTAYRYPLTQPTVTRYVQGWGMPNLQNLYDIRAKIFTVDESDVLTEFESRQFTVTVVPGEPELRVTMTYADPAGTTSSSQHRINDLTLRVTSPGGDMYWGNNGLAASNFSSPGGSPNTIDTVENVFIENPQAGLWLVEIMADEINQDGHAETPGLDADYALVVSGALEVPPALTVRLLSGPTGLVPPGVAQSVTAEILPGIENVVPGSETLYWRLAGGAFNQTALTPVGGGMYTAMIPAATCSDSPEYYLSATGDGATVVTAPQTAPAGAFSYTIATVSTLVDDAFETDTGWTVGAPGDTATTGIWNRANPEGTAAQPEDDHTPAPGELCWVTDSRAGSGVGTWDIDNGATTLLSPVFDLAGQADAVVSYWRWYSNTAGGAPNADIFVIDVTPDGSNWFNVETVGPTGPETSGGWFYHEARIGDLINPTSTVRFRFVASDLATGSIVEAALDDFMITVTDCEDVSCPGDLDGDLDIDLEDLAVLLANFGTTSGADPEDGDVDGDGDVDLADLSVVLSVFGSVCG